MPSRFSICSPLAVLLLLLVLVLLTACTPTLARAQQPPEITQFTFGGSANDQPLALASTPDGSRVYVGGRTQSDDLPGALNAYQPPIDGFVCALDLPPGAEPAVNWCRYLGGTNPVLDQVTDVALTPDGGVLAIGFTFSDDFPTTSGTMQPTFGGNGDAFVTRLTPAGTVSWSTFYGGSASDQGKGIAVGANGDFWGAGVTMSVDLPVQDPLQDFGGGADDGFVLQGSLADGTLRFASPWGGSERDGFDDVVVQNGTVFLGGSTQSTDIVGDFPDLFTDAESPDAVLFSLGANAPTQNEVLRIGGSGTDRVSAVTARDDVVCLGGRTGSDDFFTTEEALQPDFGGGARDAYTFCRVLNALPDEFYSSYLGGSGDDEILDLELGFRVDFGRMDQHLYTGGQTDSDDFPIVNAGGAGFGGLVQVFFWFSVLNNIDENGEIIFALDVLVSAPLLLARIAQTTISLLEGIRESACATGEVKQNDIANVGLQCIAVGVEGEQPLLVDKTADRDMVPDGEMVTYTIEVENPGPMAADNVMLIDLSDATQLQYEGDNAGCTHEVVNMSNSLNCDLGTLAPGETKVVEVTFTVLEPGEIENLVGVSGSNTGAEVRDAVTIMGTPAPVVQITKTARVDRVPIEEAEVGDLIDYTITVENVGSAAAEDLEIFDFAQRGLEFLFQVPARACEEMDGGIITSVRCLFGDLAPGESESITLTFVFEEIFDPSLDNTARVTGSNVFGRIEDEVTLDVAPHDLEGTVWDARTVPSGGKRLIHQAGLDLYVDSLLFANNIEPGAGLRVPDFSLGAIAPFIHVVPTGGDLGDAVLAEQLDFFTGEVTGDDFFLPDTYALIFAGSADTPTLLLQRDARFAAQDPAQVDVFFAHAAPEAPSLSLRQFGGGEALADDLTFGLLTRYTPLAPAAHAIEMMDPDGNVLDVFEVDLTDRQGEGVGIVIVPVEGNTQSGLALVVLGSDGEVTVPPVVTDADDTGTPRRFTLHPAYPNPFNPTTTLRFDLPEAAAVRVAVYDVLGRQVLTLTPGRMAAGPGRTLTLDARSLASGAYLYRVAAEGATQTYHATGRFVLLK